MIAFWVLHAMAVAARLAAGARTAERVLGRSGRPRRWAWAVAIGGAVIVPAMGARRSADAGASVDAPPRLRVPSGGASRGSASVDRADGMALGTVPSPAAGRIGWTTVPAGADTLNVVWTVARGRR